MTCFFLSDECYTKLLETIPVWGGVEYECGVTILVYFIELCTIEFQLLSTSPFFFGCDECLSLAAVMHFVYGLWTSSSIISVWMCAVFSLVHCIIVNITSSRTMTSFMCMAPYKHYSLRSYVTQDQPASALILNSQQSTCWPVLATKSFNSHFVGHPQA